jgi:2-oxoglutarate ferredoxin oxidoreductase subunit alpha
MKEPDFKYTQYNKVMGLPFTVTELVNKFNEML